MIEDDIILAPTTASSITTIVDQGLGGYDIVYTDVLIPLLNDAYKGYKAFYDALVTRDQAERVTKARFTILDLKTLLFGSTSSYLVNKNSIKKLHDLYEKEITHEPRQSIDLFIRQLCNEGALKVGCLFPFVTSVRLDHIVETDIARDYHEMSALATHLARYSFFIDADLDKCQHYLNTYMPVPANPDKHTRILTHLLAFSLTDKYRSF